MNNNNSILDGKVFVDHKYIVGRTVVINGKGIALKFLPDSNGEALDVAMQMLVSTLHQEDMKTEGDAC